MGRLQMVVLTTGLVADVEPYEWQVFLPPIDRCDYVWMHINHMFLPGFPVSSPCHLAFDV